jgi:spermidine/putrescine-binding protein
VVRPDGDPGRCANVEEAHQFLNFILEPENIAAATNYVFYANGNLASQEFVLEEILDWIQRFTRARKRRRASTPSARL